jgi:hypothetical protein
VREGDRDGTADEVARQALPTVLRENRGADLDRARSIRRMRLRQTHDTAAVRFDRTDEDGASQIQASHIGRDRRISEAGAEAAIARDWV